ncbi:uncharacterized protein LOC134705010 [Mytilus trossulus]|uniref:uncharacterized protein LOC134705010 n=1 Tax=Mytilus trossulus TaxID=6551 RepID=UPI003004D345
MEYNLFQCLIFIFFGFLCFVNSKRYDAQLTSTLYSWEKARSSHRLIGDGINDDISDIQLTLETNSSVVPGSTYGWIDANAAYQPWMEYLGCFVINPSKILKEVAVNASTQLLECVNACPASSDIGLQQSKCVCLSTISLTSTDVTGAATRSFCSGDENAFCAPDQAGVYQFALYSRSPVTRSINSGIGDCLVMTVSSTSNPSVYFEPAPCGTYLNPHCYKTGTFIISLVKTTWNGASQFCQTFNGEITSPYHIASSSKGTQHPGSYWIAQIRKVQYYLSKDFIPGAENYCIAARVKSDGYLDILLRSCDQLLPALYYFNISPQLPGTTQNGTNRFATPSRGKDGSPHQPVSDGILAVVVSIPCLVVAVAAVTGWFTYRWFHKKAQNMNGLNNLPRQISYYESSGDFPTTTTTTEHEVSSGYEMTDIAYSEPIDCIDNEDRYNHIDHTRHREINESSTSKYHVMVSNEDKMILDGYHAINHFPKDRAPNKDYDRMSTVKMEQHGDMLDEQTSFNVYNTVPSDEYNEDPYYDIDYIDSYESD